MLPDGTELVGEFEETVGTQLVFSDRVVEGETTTKSIQLVCHTDKKIKFRRKG
jgi:hypothetical protein